MAYANKHMIRDGVLLYTRTSGKKNIFQARIRLPGTTRYVVRSLKTACLSTALVQTEELYDELRYAKKNGVDISATELKFKTLWEKFFRAHSSSLSIHRRRLHEGTATRYFIPFLGKYKVFDLHDSVIEHYWTWRISYYSRLQDEEPDKTLPANIAITPSQKTLDMEAAMLRQIFRWSKRLNLIKREPWIKAPRIQTTRGVSRRPTFSSDEWKKILTYLNSWAAERATITKAAKGGALHRKGPHSLHRIQRQMLRNYVIFMANTGLRPNEARQLKWRDITYKTGDGGQTIVVVHVAPTTKTGKRTVVCRAGTENGLERIKRISSNTKPDDLVFCDTDGQPIDTFNKTFKKVLTTLGLLTDSFGARRSIYSLRHYYCTRILSSDKVPILLVAQNMGTSISHIEKHYSHILTENKAELLHSKHYRSNKRSQTVDEELQDEH